MKEANAIPVVDENVSPVELRSEAQQEKYIIFDLDCGTAHPSHK